MKILSELFMRKEKQVELRRENQQKQAQKQLLYDIKDIFVNSFIIDNLDENAPIFEKLIQTIEKINDLDADVTEKLCNSREKV